ncbi:MAG TPA: hypothetical protein VJ951_12040, partial [Bacteroidales bacterium]|nr:hypothetical protein [Bacteroidales bacterium]
MYKRILFVGPLFVLLMSVLGSCRPDTIEVKASQAVSTDAIVYVEKLSLSFFSEDFKQENILLQEINASDLSFISKGKFEFFNQIIREITRLDDVGNSADLNVSLHLMGKDDISPIFYINAAAELSGDMLIEEFNRLYADIPENSTRTYDGMKIWEIQTGDKNEYGNLSLAIIHGLLLVSDQSVLVEDAIRTFKSNSGLSESEDFGVLAEVAGKYVQGNIYINFSKFPGLISKYLSLDKLQNSPFRGGLFANMAEYDIDVDNERVVLSGMATSSDSSVGIINAFRGQNSVRTEVIDHIPSNASEFKIFGISDFKLFRNELLLQLRYIDQLRDFESEDERLIRQGGESLFDIILNVMKDEVAWCKMDIGGEDDYSEIVFVKLKSRSEAIKQLETYWSKLVSSNQKGEEDLLYKYQLDEQSVFDIYSFPDKYYQSTYLGNYFKKHFALYENYLILSDSKNAISRTIYHNVLHKTLINDPAFKKVNDLIPSNINILIYKNPEQYFYSIENAYSELIEKDAEKVAEVLNIIPALLVQFSYEDEKFYSSLAMHYSEGYNEATGTVWESLLDTVVKMKPVFVENHYTGEQEIIIQDAND